MTDATFRNLTVNNELFLKQSNTTLTHLNERTLSFSRNREFYTTYMRSDILEVSRAIISRTSVSATLITATNIEVSDTLLVNGIPVKGIEGITILVTGNQTTFHRNGVSSSIQFRVNDHNNTPTNMEFRGSTDVLPGQLTVPSRIFLSNSTGTERHLFTSYISLIDASDINQIQRVRHHAVGLNYFIESMQNSGAIHFKLKTSGGTDTQISFDQFGNLSGLNHVFCNRVTCGQTVFQQNGSVFNGAVTFHQMFVLNGFANFNNDILMSGTLSQINGGGITQSTGGINTFKESIYTGKINMTATDPVQNRIIQSTIEGDVTNWNVLKQIQLKTNTNFIPTVNSILQMWDTSTGHRYDFLINAQDNNYNNLVDVNDMAIVAFRTNANNASVVYTCWCDQKLGLKLKAPSASNHTLELWGGNMTNITMNSISGTSMTGVSSIGFTGGKTVNGNFGNIYNLTTLQSGSIENFVERNLSTYNGLTTTWSNLLLSPGTYIISWNITFLIQTASTTVTGYYGAYSTSESSFSDNTILSSQYNGNSIPVGNVFSVSGQNQVHFNATTPLYLRAVVSHNRGANHVIFHAPFSYLKAIKIC